MKRIRILCENGETISADLLTEQAPITCKVIWDSLPVQGRLTHSRWSGREVNFPYSSKKNKLMRENQTIYTSKGELCYWCDRNGEHSNEQLLEVIALYYGAEHARSHIGDEPVNVFAQVPPEDFHVIEKVGERIWLNGTEDITLEREEE